MNLKVAGSKDSPCVNSIPTELRSDGKPSLNHIGGPGGVSPIFTFQNSSLDVWAMGSSFDPFFKSEQLTTRSSPGGYRNNMGPQSGGGVRRDGKMGGTQSLNRMQMGQQHWGMGMGLGHPMAIPPPAPRAPKVMELHREEVKLHKAENAWKPTVTGKRDRNKDGEPKDEEQLILEVRLPHLIPNPKHKFRICMPFLNLKFWFLVDSRTL